MNTHVSQQPLIETIGLSRSFGGLAALKNVDLKIMPGEIRCLIGPNGAGKSTLFKCLTHQIIPSAGDVLYAGKSLRGMPAFKISRLGVAIKNQIPSVYLDLDVRENIAIAAIAHGIRGAALKAVVEKTLAAIELDERTARKKVSELSHAHRQWCELGMLVVSEPNLVLLDEPTAGMTRNEMLRTIEIIRHLNRSATVIVVEHDMEFIQRLAQRVTVLHRGQVFFEGTMRDVDEHQGVRDIYLGRKKDVVHA